jgi:hypothetical protein
MQQACIACMDACLHPCMRCICMLHAWMLAWERACYGVCVCMRMQTCMDVRALGPIRAPMPRTQTPSLPAPDLRPVAIMMQPVLKHVVGLRERMDDTSARVGRCSRPKQLPSVAALRACRRRTDDRGACTRVVVARALTYPQASPRGQAPDRWISGHMVAE